ncbi:hypothetical protein HUB94_26935 (plasmid) [Paenibacillus cellulosilyticus]|uniref:hypothetical protein n=1 Tax=Paenibacillus cellulosilyticus TaxID=375489 RepID=UPI00157FD5FC|nr:hypothetical protein [Paenibacillus cellulosilyticus]QKS47935.1 hypothetical protein HUB94_26935 [Paenibacillus cellulosilyticus]
MLELIKTLSEAQLKFTRLHSELNTQAFVGLLAGCQEFAIHIGQYIEKYEGEDTQTVSLLENYCDILYLASVEVDNGGDSTPHIMALQDQLRQIEDSVKTELGQRKIEIAFLPYKASMWDSCESIWLAAKEDPQCDAYVVPIPYFDRLPGGALGQMHYEGDQFPDDVPITDWQSYKIDERRPDVIVTINPYDDTNLVTMVHPNFFSKRLKDLTDMLVYVPYFVSMDDVDEHFCKCAGVLYADRVIVQSDKIRQTYLRVLKRYEQANQCVGRFGNMEEKIVALGSPKFDKVINTKREDCVVPDDWQKLIERTDGTRKKVVLYNTSITALLEGNEHVLHKLRYVFDSFKNRDDVVLLWRPHPLNGESYKAMRPQLLKDYLSIVEEYQSLGFGIYDDTADLHRSIAISDAYYGDGGSLGPLYLSTGKPVMMQDLYFRPALDTLLLQSMYVDKQHIWFTARDFNGLFCMDRALMKPKYVGSFDEENSRSLYVGMTQYQDKLYFAPYLAEQMAAYDIEHQSFEHTALGTAPRLNWLHPREKGFFQSVFRYEHYLFLIPITYPAIIRYNLNTGERDDITDWVAHTQLNAENSPYYLQWNKTFDFGRLLASSVASNATELVMTLWGSNELVILDAETLDSRIVKVGEADERFAGVCFDGTNYWLAARNQNYMVRWNPYTQKYKKVVFPDAFLSGRILNFLDVVYAGGYVWLLPYEANMALRLNPTTGEVTTVSELTDAVNKERYKYIQVSLDGDFIYAATVGRIVVFDTINAQCRIQNLWVDEQDQKIVNNRRRESLKINAPEWSNLQKFIYPESYTGIQTYLDYVVDLDELPFALSQAKKQIECAREVAGHLDGTVGQAIYEYVIGG